MNGRSTVNRLLLGLCGVVLLGGGLLILSAGFDLYHRLGLSPPAGWPATTTHDVLVSNADRIRWSGQGWWWWPAVIAVLTLAAILALGWLIAQLRHRPGALHLGGTPPPESVELRGQALGDAVASEARTLPDVEQADAHLAGRATGPQLRIALTLTDHGLPAPALQALCRGPVAHARASTGLPRLPIHALLHVGRHKARRAE